MRWLVPSIHVCIGSGAEEHISEVATSTLLLQCPITTSTRGRNAQTVTSLDAHVKFRWQPTAPVTVRQRIFTALGRLPASQTVGLQLAPIRKHRHLGVAEEFDFTDNAISTGVLPLAPRAMANSVLCDPERKGVF